MRKYRFRDKDLMYLEQGLEPYHMFEGWAHECRAREYCLRNDDVVVDVGACIGAWTVPAAAIGKHVHAFEPNSHWARLIIANATLNQLQDKVTVYQKAVWSKEDWVLYDGWYSGKINYDQEYRVHGVALDAMNFDPIPNFIKIDTEGEELSVLEGAQKLIHEHTPRLLIEAHKEPNKNIVGAVKEKVFELNNDYQLTIINENEDQYAHMYFETKV